MRKPKRDKVVTFRLTDAELAQLKANAKRAGLSISDYVRIRVKPMPFLPAVVTGMGQITTTTGGPVTVTWNNRAA